MLVGPRGVQAKAFARLGATCSTSSLGGGREERREEWREKEGEGRERRRIDREFEREKKGREESAGRERRKVEGGRERERGKGGKRSVEGGGDIVR